jgi:hypothetical protein
LGTGSVEGPGENVHVYIEGPGEIAHILAVLFHAVFTV